MHQHEFAACAMYHKYMGYVLHSVLKMFRSPVIMLQVGFIIFYLGIRKNKTKTLLSPHTVLIFCKMERSLLEKQSLS